MVSNPGFVTVVGCVEDISLDFLDMKSLDFVKEHEAVGKL